MKKRYVNGWPNPVVRGDLLGKGPGKELTIVLQLLSDKHDA